MIQVAIWQIVEEYEQIVERVYSFYCEYTPSPNQGYLQFGLAEILHI